MTIPFEQAMEADLDETSWIAVELKRLEVEGGLPPTPKQSLPSAHFAAKVYRLQRTGLRDSFRISVPRAVLDSLHIWPKCTVHVQWERADPALDGQNVSRKHRLHKAFCRMCGQRLQFKDRFCDRCGIEVI